MTDRMTVQCAGFTERAQRGHQWLNLFLKKNEVQIDKLIAYNSIIFYDYLFYSNRMGYQQDRRHKCDQDKVTTDHLESVEKQWIQGHQDEVTVFC